MMFSFFFCFKLLLLLFLPVSSQSVQPCYNYSELNNPFRSIAYVATVGVDTMICDVDIISGWYRFVNEVGGKMPEFKIDKYHCGTVAPIWMQGPHPSEADGVVDRTACVNFNDMFGGCLSFTIQVKNCSSFYVYYLVPPPFGCNMAYCAGEERPCPRGQSGLFPNCIVLQRKDFPLAEVPVPKVTYLDDNEMFVTLKCYFDYPTANNVSFEIQWFVNGVVSTASTLTICKFANEGSCDERHATLSTNNYKLGDQVRCDIRARYNTHHENTWTKAVPSELFFAGIETYPTTLDLKECDLSENHRIQLRSNLPIRGSEPISLRFGVTETFDHSQALPERCLITLEPGEMMEWENISVQAVCDNTDQQFSPQVFTFSVVSFTDFWFGYELPAITVRKIENSIGICKATGDPHYTTFDDLYYDYYGTGDFVLYRNRQRNFEIHTRLWNCWSDRTCNCGVAIREYRDVIVLNTCTNDFKNNYGSPMKILIPSNRPLTRGTRILTRHPGGYSEYEVRLPSGTVVNVKRFWWGNNVEMKAPSSDAGNTEGMCGNFNGIDTREDEFSKGGDGNPHGTDEVSFGDSWRVNTAESLFRTVPPCLDDACENSELDLDRCRCVREGGSFDVTCDLSISQFNNIGDDTFNDDTENFENGNRKKREMSYSDEKIYLYDNEKAENSVSFAHRKRRAVDMIMSLKNATDYCRKTILNTKAAEVCMEISGVNASSAIRSCAADLQATGDVEWVESAFESLKSSCTFHAIRNYSAYEKDDQGNVVPPVRISQNLCPNDCSFNGNCTNGTCACKEGFISADCSMRFDEIPKLFRILDSGLCDIRDRPCLKTIVFGEHFLDSKNLTCHIREFKVVPSQWIPSNETKLLNGSKTDLFAIACDLPKPPINLGDFDVEGTPAAEYQISVSNDRVHESESLKLITFDSVCQECNVSYGCILKTNSCLIKGHCFAEGAPSPRDWCQLCNSSLDHTRWTRRLINLPPNITTPSQRYALHGEHLMLQLEGTDPEERPFKIEMMNGSPPEAILTQSRVLVWTAKTFNSTEFFFRARDECNASSTFNMTIDILSCPCVNDGICIPDVEHPRGSGMYVCSCQPGYQGQQCEEEIDECLSSPCINGTCVDGINNYTCQCERGFTGFNCEQDIDECRSFPCINGTCVDKVDGFDCFCQAGFSGMRCDVDMNDCLPVSCGNGTCIDHVNNYSCICDVGFTGTHCEVLITHCSNDSCYPEVSCTEKDNTISCSSCPSGFTGDGKNCKDIDDCVNHTCSNGGSCVDGVNNYSCNCLLGFTGKYCETDIDDCINQACSNGGTCEDGVNSFFCNCTLGFTGNHCETDIDDCINQTCSNGGTCEDGVNSFFCNCTLGFTGNHCETDIDDCVNHTCGNGGSCKDGVHSYSCNCLVGFTGDHCETDIDDCVNHSCSNGGTCEDGVNSYSCNCPGGYTGDHCETDIYYCINHTCQNGASCVDGLYNYSCKCPTGYTGSHCETGLSSPSASITTTTTHAASTSKPSTTTIVSPTSTTTRTSSAASSRSQGIRVTPITSSIKVSIRSPSVATDIPSYVQDFTTVTVQPTTQQVIKVSSTTSSAVTDISSSVKDFTTSTVRPTTRKPETRLVVQLRIQQIWNEDLEDKNSQAFKELSETLVIQITKHYSQDDSFVGVEILSFRPGSVVAEFQLSFKNNLEDEKALTPLKRAVQDGKLGPLTVDPESLKIKKDVEEPTEESKVPLPLIIGVSCGGIFILAVLSVYLIRYCHRRKMLSRRRVSDVMPTEVAFPNPEKYELQETESKEDIVRYEETSMWKNTASYEELAISQDAARYEKLPFANGATHQEVGISNAGRDSREIRISFDDLRLQEMGVLKKFEQK